MRRGAWHSPCGLRQQESEALAVTCTGVLIMLDGSSLGLDVSTVCGAALDGGHRRPVSCVLGHGSGPFREHSFVTALVTCVAGGRCGFVASLHFT